MLKFDKEQFLSDGATTYALRGEIESKVDELLESGFENVVLMGVGGTIFEMMSVAEIFKRYSDLNVEVVNAAEGLVTNPENITKQTIVVTGSKSGDTKETVAFAQWCKDKGARVLSFTGQEDNLLAKSSTHTVISDLPGMENTYLKLYLFATCLMNRKGYFDDYQEFADQMAHLHENLAKWREQYDGTAQEIAENYALEPYQMWIGSGILWGEIELFTMCILEEMQWMRTRPVTSADFFHGPLELIDETVPVYLVKGEDEMRPLDERVEKFLNKVAKKVVIIDTTEFKLENINDKFRIILSPIIFNNITRGRLCYHMEAITNHDLDTRRYYRQFEY